MLGLNNVKIIKPEGEDDSYPDVYIDGVKIIYESFTTEIASGKCDYINLKIPCNLEVNKG